jgi:hypothetical protein
MKNLSAAVVTTKFICDECESEDRSRKVTDSALVGLAHGERTVRHHDKHVSLQAARRVRADVRQAEEWHEEVRAVTAAQLRPAAHVYSLTANFHLVVKRAMVVGLPSKRSRRVVK